MNVYLIKRFQLILALLFAGSVSMLAEGDDPFPVVPHSKYQANMTLTAQVVLNGEILTSEAIVAVYHDDQIRGKGRPNNQNILSITVDGDIDDEHIFFKVYTNGRIIEVDQGAEYTYYGKIGSYDDPYIINLPLVTTTTSSEGWGTTCLPYNAAMPDGVTVYAAREADGDVLRLTPLTGTILPKETPVLLKTDGKKSVEWLSRVADGDVTIETNLFKGTTEATTVAAGSVLTLGHATDGNKAIGFWLYNGTTIPANKAYLEKSESTSRGLTLNWEDTPTGVSCATLNDKGEMKNEACFDLQGRRMVNGQHAMLNGQIRITNGKKYLVR